MEIDKRRGIDIEERIKELAASYDTGWLYDQEDADIGGALSKVFASQVEDNIAQKNDVLNRYHTEFINLLDISLLPSKPSGSVVVAELVDTGLAGTYLQKGTQLMSGEAEPVIFETDHTVYITGSQLHKIFMTDAQKGAVIPLLGRFVRPDIPGEIPFEDSAQNGEAEEEGAGEELQEGASPEDERNIFQNDSLRSFTLFGEHEGIDRNALIFYHPTVFDVEDNNIYVRIKGCKKLVEEIEKGEMYFAYVAASGIQKTSAPVLLEDGETFLVQKTEKCRRIEVREKEYFVFLLVSKDIPDESRRVDSIEFSSSGAPCPIESASDGQNDFSVEEFLPFTDTLALYAECFIGHDGYFSKAGAKIKLRFDLSFDEHRLTMTAQQIEDSLKIIKKKPRTLGPEVGAEAYVQEVAIEYYNGTGWKKLPMETDARNIFSTDRGGEYIFEFICPDDWESTSAGAYNGKILRMQVLKSDNCYLRPCTHHYPKIKNMQVSFSYEDHYVKPTILEMISGTRKRDLTSSMQNGKSYLTFRPSIYHDDALYLGFSKALEGGPVSLLFLLEDRQGSEELKCRFEYSTAEGYKILKVADHTQDFTRSGIVRFMPPPDMKKVRAEGGEAFWIRVVRGKGREGYGLGERLPVVKNIIPNAVSVSNIETQNTLEFFVERLEPNMRFALGTTNILDADVWVNEVDRFTRDDMRRQLEAEPENVYAEFDMLGNFTSFYRKWEEVPYFLNAKHPRVYVLDRLRNQLIFGDGVQTWFPRVTDDTAIRVRLRRSNGANGNVAVGEINSPLGYLPYIGEVSNPIRAYGGSDIETVEEAMQRGSNLLSSGRRLVSLEDYKRAILSFSDTIDQVRGVTGQFVNLSIPQSEGRPAADESDIYFAVLMKEYADGSFAFQQILGGLKKYLLAHSEITLTEERIHIVEPVFVKVNLEAWVSIVDMDDSFELQPLLEGTMKEYLNPLGYSRGRGWKIGTLPKKSQLLMRLNSLKAKALIKRSMITVSYIDGEGQHEMDLEDVAVTPFMLPVSGTHKVHVLY
ncbi:MAG: hypothetical protein IJU50_10695 [Lachnospiraceae bacterium]|nr:hypothetical protein [Lachnospiraceae bacterium]